jgi:predicted dinucleotide-binding enzyme
MNIGIIGAGQIGELLASKLIGLGHDVRIANSRGPDTLGEVVSRTGATALRSDLIASGVDIVIVAVPQKSVEDLSNIAFDTMNAGGFVIDAGNYYPSWRDGEIAPIEAGVAESRWVADQLGCRVVKAFNNMSALSLMSGGRPRGDLRRLALPVASDEPAAKRRVFALIDALGFDPVDGGTLECSWRQQPGSPAYCTDLDARLLGDALRAAERSKLPELRERAVRSLGERPPIKEPSEFVALMRSFHSLFSEL